MSSPSLAPATKGLAYSCLLVLFSRQQFSFLNLKRENVVGIRVWKTGGSERCGGFRRTGGDEGGVLKTVFLPADNVQAKGVFSQ